MQLAEEINCNIDPFLKWAGGKRWLLKRGVQIAPDNYLSYIEPFLGSGAVFFSMPQDHDFILADVNSELIDCYRAVCSNWRKVQELLKEHDDKHSKDYYYYVRSRMPEIKEEIAARFIYLNRTCWNGLYRVNLAGKFNVPIGTKTQVVLDTDDFEKTSKILKGGKIFCQDFEKTINKAESGDFLFVDPPYTVKHNLNGFIKYNEKIFTWDDQVRLRDALVRAVSRGAQVTVTNANHECIHDLYSDKGFLISIDRSSVIAGSSRHRGKTSEVIIRMGWKA